VLSIGPIVIGGAGHTVQPGGRQKEDLGLTDTQEEADHDRSYWGAAQTAWTTMALTANGA